MANTPILKGAKFYICATPQADDLNRTGFEALTYVEAGKIIEHGNVGGTQNFVSQVFWGDSVTQKQKGNTDAGSPTVMIGYDPDDTGHDALDVAAATKFNYAFKVELDDAESASTTNTIIYNRGLISIAEWQLGANEAFADKTYTLGFNQLQVVVKPEAV